MDTLKLEYAATRGIQIGVAVFVMIYGLATLRLATLPRPVIAVGLPFVLGVVYACLVYFGVGPFTAGT